VHTAAEVAKEPAESRDPQEDGEGKEESILSAIGGPSPLPVPWFQTSDTRPSRE
jgi:hypothetical protein